MIEEIPDRCPECERLLVKENDFVLCTECREIIADLREEPDGPQD